MLPGAFLFCVVYMYQVVSDVCVVFFDLIFLK